MTVQLSLFDKGESEKIKQSKFKDKCDVCGKFDYLRGYNNICICQMCRDIIKKGGDIDATYKSRVCRKSSKQC